MNKYVLRFNYVRIHFFTLQKVLRKTQMEKMWRIVKFSVELLERMLKKQAAISSKKILGLKRLDLIWQT